MPSAVKKSGPIVRALQQNPGLCVGLLPHECRPLAGIQNSPPSPWQPQIPAVCCTVIGQVRWYGGAVAWWKYFRGLERDFNLTVAPATSSSSATTAAGGNSRQVYTVLGCPRGGTSAVTRALQCLGVDLGEEKNLRRPGLGNPEGFWEDLGVQDLCERCMAAFNMEWDSLRLLKPADWDSTGGKLFLAESGEIVASRIARAADGRWGCKNPRMARTLWMWMEAFRRADCQDSYIIVLRNPLSVAASIIANSPHRAVGNNPTHIHLAWLVHMLGSMEPALLGKPAVIVDYDLMLANPQAQLQRMADGLHLPNLPQNQSQIDHYCNEFLKPGARHAVFTQKDIETNPLIPSLVARAYQLLAAAAADQTSLSAAEFKAGWAQVQADAADRQPLFAYIDWANAKLVRRHPTLRKIYQRLPLGIKRLLARASAQ